MIGVLLVSRLNTADTAKVASAIDVGRGTDVVLDEVSSLEVAATVADVAGLMVADQVAEIASQASAQNELTAAEDQLMKPAIVSTEVVTSGDIKKHVVAEGETLAAIASKYNITTNTIKWANDLRTENVAVGRELTILPVNGVLYTIADGDTPESIAQIYQANPKQIVAFNDAEVNGLVPGEQIVVPEGIKPAPAAPRTRSVDVENLRGGYRFFNVGYTLLGNVKSLRGQVSNTYAAGWCTWWAAHRSSQLGNPIQNQWGNAITWDNRAAATGQYHVNGTPRVGAVGFRGNHVVTVEAVSADGSMIKYSDMNGLAGWGRAAITNDWVPASGFSGFIYHK